MKINNLLETKTLKFELDLIPNLKFLLLLKQIKPEGNIVYEYNPLRNFRYTETNNKLDYKGEEIIPYTITDLDTDKFNFNLNYPVDIQCLPSYDGSVNLILNDNLNSPKLINTRFTALQNNTYKIIDRIGTNDTNLYDEDLFDLDTSLYKKINEIPKIEFLGLVYGGNMPVGNYTFYFKYCDADDNETDFIGESSNVICHIGNINDPSSIRGGMLNENSGKIVQFLLTNTDSSYDYVTVYYTRLSSNVNESAKIEAAKINKKFKIKGNLCLISIDGYETNTAITLKDINTTYFTVDKAKTLVQCLNRLFLGNLESPSLDYQDLTDLSLRMLPYYKSTKARDLIGELDLNYKEIGNAAEGYEYYNVKNIYNHLGYWNEEIYRLGIVYILNNDSLSPVFNIRGINELPKVNTEGKYSNQNLSIFDAYGNRLYLTYDETTYLIDLGINTNLENAKGVVRINDNKANDINVYSIQIKISTEIIDYLKKSNKIKGFFFVRLKRIPTILALAFTMGHDSLSGIPLIHQTSEKFKDSSYLAESFINKKAILTHNYQERLFRVLNRLVSNECAICPDYELRLPYFNSLFTDTEFVIKSPNVQLSPCALDINLDFYEKRHYYKYLYSSSTDNSINVVKILGIEDGVYAKRNDKNLFSASAGNAEQVNEFKFIGKEEELEYVKDKKILNNTFTFNYNNNIVRGNFGPYIGISNYKGKANQIINIYIPNYNISDMDKYFTIRYEDTSAYFAISDRIALKTLKDTTFELFRGDCYICNFTHRLNRNFLSVMSPNNDVIVDEFCWRDHYKPQTNVEELLSINIGDLNAIRLGSWITSKYCSSINLSMRDLDFSYPDEALLTGNKRTFYPLSEISTDGNYKIPESTIINNGISNILSEKYNFTYADVPYIKNNFYNRIIFSDVSVNDAFKNGFRVFLANNFLDYPSIYGGITKLLELGSYILCVFEHGIGIIPILERVLQSESTGGNIYINSNKILPDTLTMISTTFGSLWSDSIIKTSKGVYGVDTVAKKIWKTDGLLILLISDNKISDFLINNISLTERELSPIIGIRNVKSHFNLFKNDVMFTFYDNLYGFEEKVWNICWNEQTEQFETFYSWIPSYSENIDNIYFSFDRNTSKQIAKLGLCNFNNSMSEGITLSKVNFTGVNDYAELYLKNRPLPNDNNTNINYYITYSLEKDHFKNYEHFEIINPTSFEDKNTSKLIFKNGNIEDKQVWLLNIKAYIHIISTTDTSLKNYVNTFNKYVEINGGYYTNLIAISSDSQIKTLTTDFWKHGQAGIIDIQDPIKPCNWYGKLHPFEIEFVVSKYADKHKIFDTLEILSNNAEPESFHYEIIGDCFDFSNDKQNMYIRLEMHKDLLQYNGYDITYNKEAINLQAKKLNKSTILPLYYSKINTFDEIYDSYQSLTSKSKNYSNLSGSEIIYYSDLNEYRINNHVKGVDIKKEGRLRGNMSYIEDKWLVLINPIVLKLKNEIWNNIIYKNGLYEIGDKEKLPIIISNNPIPEEPSIILNDSEDKIPLDLRNLNYCKYDLDSEEWYNRLEILLKDKFIKIKIRYKGDNLVILAGIKTLFRIVI